MEFNPMSQNDDIEIEKRFNEAITYAFEVLSYLKIKIITSAFTGRSLTLVKRDGSYIGKIFGSINYDSLETDRDTRGIELLYPESTLPLLSSLGFTPSRTLSFEDDKKYVLELPRECYKEKELLVKLIKLAHESN